MILAAAGGSVGITEALNTDGGDGNLHGGTMALNSAYQVSDKLYIGPDSAKANVSPESGRVYMAADTDVDYYGDGSGWNKRDVGSQTEPVNNIVGNSVETVEQEITGQTHVQAYFDSILTTTQGDFVTMPFTTGVTRGVDNLGEWDNSNHHWSPSETGYYLVSLGYRVEYASNIEDVYAVFRNTNASDPQDAGVNLAHVWGAARDMDASATAIIEVKDTSQDWDAVVRTRGNSTDITTEGRGTYLNIWRLPI